MIAFLGDLHSNLEASRTVFRRVGELGCEKIYVLGDFVGYSCHPNEVIDLCIAYGVEGVRGNHDEAVLAGDISHFNEIAAEAIFWTRKNLSSSSWSFLRNLPLQKSIEISGKRCLLVHGSPEDPLEEYVYPDYPDSMLERFLGEYDMLGMGHTHIPFVRVLKEKMVFNPGSVGQPRDGTPQACFGLCDGGKMVYERISYDIEEEARTILSNDLPGFCAERLFLGI